MDIRRMTLWESRNATFMQNNYIRTVIEDQGEVGLELSTRTLQGGILNALSLPYFRGTGSSVYSDPNYEFWKSKQTVYQAGGIYFTFPNRNEQHINSNVSYWMVRRYGTEESYGGVWRLSELKSREEGNRFLLRKLDLILPEHPVLYTLIEATNLGDESLDCVAEVHAMLGCPFIDKGCLIQTSASRFVAFAPNLREVAVGQFESDTYFSSLEKAPLKKGGTTNAGIIPGVTGSYDYLMAEAEGGDLEYITVTNPHLQLCYALLFPGEKAAKADPRLFPMPNMDFTFNYLGRMDAPWALYEGGTPQVFSLTLGAGYMDHHGAFPTSPTYSLSPSESKRFIYANAFLPYENTRLNNGYYTMEKGDMSLTMKRTKSYTQFAADYRFRIISTLMDRLSESVQ
jgi:hypothetical protein